MPDAAQEISPIDVDMLVSDLEKGDDFTIVSKSYIFE